MPHGQGGGISFFVKRSGGRVAGPFPESAIIKQIQGGILSGNELVSRDGVDWEPLMEHVPFAHAAARVARSRTPLPSPEAPRVGSIPDAFESGEHRLKLVDLPGPAEGPVDLPAPADRTPPPRAESDLPAPDGELMDLPAPEEIVDLPAPEEDIDLPAPVGDTLDLSMPLDDEVDLPAPLLDEPELPMPEAGAAELIAPAGTAGHDGPELPRPAHGESELPAPERQVASPFMSAQEPAEAQRIPTDMLLGETQPRADTPLTEPDDEAQTVDLDSIAAPQEELARPEFVSPAAPRLKPPPLPPDIRAPKALLVVVNLLVILLGLGVGLGVTKWGMFGVGLFTGKAKVAAKARLAGGAARGRAAARHVTKAPTAPKGQGAGAATRGSGKGKEARGRTTKAAGGPDGQEVAGFEANAGAKGGEGGGATTTATTAQSGGAGPEEAKAGHGPDGGVGRDGGTPDTGPKEPQKGEDVIEMVLASGPGSRKDGVPMSDSYSRYLEALADLKKKIREEGAVDETRCAFALTSAFFVIRYGDDGVRLAEARKALDKVSDEGKESALCRTASAGLLVAARKRKAAQENLKALLEDDPRNADAFYLEAELLVQKGQTARAIRVLKDGMMLRDSDPRLTYAMAKAKLSLGSRKEGRQLMEELLQKDPDHPWALMFEADVLVTEGKLDQALEILRRICSKDKPQAPPALQARAHQMIASILVKQGKGDEAVRELDRALDKKKGDVDILADLGRLYHQRGQYMAAYEQFKTINNLGSPQLDASIGQIRALLAMRKLGEASEEIHKARKLWPKDARLPYFKGLVLEERGRTKEARERYEEALAADPKFYLPTVRLAQLLLKEGKTKEAIETIEEAISKNPRAAVLYDGLGDVYLRMGKLDKAKQAFEKALELDPKLESARFNLASTLLNMKRYKAALRHFKRVQRMGNDTIELHYGLARAYQALKRYDEAIQEYNSVLALDPDNEEYAFVAGTAYFEKGEYDKARERFDQALTLDSRLHRAHFLAGLSYLKEGNPRAAEGRLRLALEYFRDSLEYGFWLGVALELQGKTEEAKEEYLELDQVIQRMPDRIKEVPDLYFRLGRLILYDGKPKLAVKYLTKALSRKEKRPEPWYLTGEALFQLNLYDKAISFFKEAIKRKKSLFEVHYRLAMCYLLLEPPAKGKAMAHFRQVILYDKEHKYVDAYRQLGFLLRDSHRKAEAAKMLKLYLKYASPKAADRAEVERELIALTEPTRPVFKAHAKEEQ